MLWNSGGGTSKFDWVPYLGNKCSDGGGFGGSRGEDAWGCGEMENWHMAAGWMEPMGEQKCHEGMTWQKI